MTGPRGAGRGPQASLLDVARSSGHSKSTVSRALLGQPGVADGTRDRIIAVAQELGYIKDRRGQDLKSRATTSIGIYARSARLSHYGELIALVQEGIESFGARTLIASAASADPSDTRSFAELLGQRPDAVIVASGRVPEETLRTAARWTPTILLGRTSETLHHISSAADDGSGAGELALRVAAAGHHDVGVVTAEPTRSATLHPRAEAMRKGLERLGVRVRTIPLDEHRDAPSADALTTALSQVTAIMSPNDPILLATWEMLWERSVQVPDDISLTGYDGTGQLASPILGITTWRQPIEAIAASTVDLVQHALAGGAPRHVSLTGAYVAGRTLAARRGSGGAGVN